MIKDGKAYFLNPWYNREVQMPEFSGVEWGAGVNPFITAEERDQIASALLRFAEKKGREEKEAFDAAMVRQKKAAEEGELERLAALQRRQAREQATPQPAPPPARIQQANAPQQPAKAKETRVEARAQQVTRGQPIRVVVRAGPLNLSRITARVVR